MALADHSEDAAFRRRIGGGFGDSTDFVVPRFGCRGLQPDAKPWQHLPAAYWLFELPESTVGAVRNATSWF